MGEKGSPKRRRAPRGAGRIKKRAAAGGKRGYTPRLPQSFLRGESCRFGAAARFNRTRLRRVAALQRLFRLPYSYDKAGTLRSYEGCPLISIIVLMHLFRALYFV